MQHAGNANVIYCAPTFLTMMHYICKLDLVSETYQEQNKSESNCTTISTINATKPFGFLN